MQIEEAVSGIVQELRRGTLILLVLSQLREPKYGYSLIGSLSERGIGIDANTLYPLLRRLEAQGLLASRWQVGEAKPRKYYALTSDGQAVLEACTARWHELSESVNNVLEESK